MGLPAIAKAIKDKEIIKHLLFDYDGWARYKKDSTRREMAYHALVDNITDEDMIWQLYANTSPTKKSDVISVAYLSGLSAKLSAAIRSKTDLEGHSSEGVWKWVDSYHKFHAEINDEEGTLTLRAPVEEGIFNKSDISQEQANAVFDVFAGVDDDVDYYDN